MKQFGENVNLYETFLKPIFFHFSPEKAHDFATLFLKTVDILPMGFQVLEKITTYSSNRFKVNISGIDFPNPLGLAAGFDKTGELYPYFSKLGFGFLEVGTVTGEEQPGNPSPRLFRYPDENALVNRMGFNNPGCERVFQTLNIQKKTIPRGINIGKTKAIPLEKTVDDYVKSFQKLSKISDYGVINISSPNTPGLRGFQEKEAFLQLIQGIKQGLGGQFLIPTFVKLAPDLKDRDIEEILEIIIDLGVSGVVLTNTTIQKNLIKKYNSVEDGGISGEPLRNRSTEVIQLAYQKLQGRLPIIGVGGIDSGITALEKIIAGANLIQIYTGYIYKGPFLPYMILEYLDGFMVKNGIKNINELTGLKI
ncbi:MAG: quinone-dependent dihydroorotate dehydrogenase [Leptospiraceae bacterium]|nr:quinone-dependent dihydroorotate dehydrogenase [Leptospiraceae bacterium]